MNDRAKFDVEFDGGLFNENANKFPADELAKYAGQYVAWNLDGTQILTGGSDREEAERKLQAMGGDPSQVVWDYIPSAEEDAVL
jgi:hypothetical protein